MISVCISGRMGDGMTSVRYWKKGIFTTSLGVLIAVGAAPVLAESTGTGQQVAQNSAVATYDIPAQPLISAITAFGRQSGLQVVVDEALLATLQAHAVAGDMSADQALAHMLTGTGLTWRVIDDKTVALEVAPVTPLDSTQLAPMTVTAERAERSIMNTATSVVVLDDETLEQRPGLQSTNDVLEGIPNVVSAGTGNFAPAVRGLDGTGPAQGADAFLAGTRPRLNIAVDGRPLSYNEVVFGDVGLWDVQQVEVLRGAQSTLQGRNAIAGTVAVKTKDPTYDYEFGGRFIGGNYDGRIYSGMASGPIIDDELAFRMAIDYQTHDSYVHFNEIPSEDDPEKFRSMNVRGKLLIEPDAWDGFSTLLTIQHAAYQGPQTESVSHPKGDHDAAFPDMPMFNPKSTGGTAATSWEINENWTIENTLSITDVDIERKALPGDGNAHIDAFEIVGEPRVRFTGLDGDLTILTGFYAFNGRQDETIDLLGGGAFDDKTDTYAVFTEGTYTFLEDFDITIGGRYERERRRRTGAMNIFEIDLDKTYEAFLPKFGAAWHPSEEFTLGAVVSRGYNGGGAGFTFEPPFESYTFKPEYVWTYEAYARADLFENSLSLTGNVFYSRYKDIQLPFDLNPDPDVWSQVIRNADRAETYGAEIGVRWQATSELQLYGDLGLLQTKITKYSGSELQGNELALSPDVTANVGLIYRHESGFDFSADARFADNYFSSVENNQDEETDPYVLLNLQTGYSLGDDDANVRVFGFVNNVFDSRAETLIERGAVSADDSITIVSPRTFGIGLQAKF